VLLHLPVSAEQNLQTELGTDLQYRSLVESA
jgi:hypothetical protein